MWRLLDPSLSSSCWKVVESIWVSMRRSSFHTLPATSPTTRKLSSPRPCWSTHSRPYAFGWWSTQFRRLVSTLRLALRQVFHYVQCVWSVFWLSTHPASSLSTRQSFCHRTFGFQLLFQLLRPCSFGSEIYWSGLFTFSCRDFLLSVFYPFFIVTKQHDHSDTTCQRVCAEECICDDL